MRILLSFILWIMLSGGFSSLFGQEEQKTRSISGFRIDLDQDFFLEKIGLDKLNEDRNYTQGFGLALFSPRFTDNWYQKRILPKSDPTNKDFILYLPAEFTFQFAGFTPDNLRDSLPIIGDRPYSSVFFLGLKFASLNASRFSSRQHGFFIGAMGIEGPAKNIQTSIHKGSNQGNTRPPYNPMGWHNQVSNGGEPVAMYSGIVTRLITKKKLIQEIKKGHKEKDHTNYLVSYNYGYSLGYLTQVSAGFNARFGMLDLSNWHSDLFNQTGAIASVGDVDSITPKHFQDYYLLAKKTELYLFASMQYYTTVFNASLHGQFRHSNYRLDYGDTGFINGQARLGAGFTSAHHSLALFMALKTPDIWNAYSRVHAWLGCSLSMKWKDKKNGKNKS